VLLEVVLALVLFVGAAAILSSGLSSSMDSLDRLRVSTHAADMALTVMSELQMGTKSLNVSGPQPIFEAPIGWTYELVATPFEGEMEEKGPYQKIEVIIRREEPTFVYRLTQVVRLGARASAAGAMDEEPSFEDDF
jgi:hypothetical protein